MASGVERVHGSGHAKKRSGGRAKGSDEFQDAQEGYGPLGPLSDWEHPRAPGPAGAGSGRAGQGAGKGKRV